MRDPDLAELGRVEEFRVLGLERIKRLPGDDVFVHRLHQRFLEALLVKLLSRFSRQDRGGSGSEA